MEGEVMANPNFDVYVYLVQKLSTERAAGSTSNKKRRISIRDSINSSEARGHGRPLAKLKAKASKLRECSAYFETCMSERWAQSNFSSKTKFCLEVQTEVKYYIDCFSRIHFLCKPIASVTDCIELLKVASQIGFQAVVDIGVKYLAAAPWSDHEEKLVREFCSSPHLVPCDSLRDLLVRLEDLPSGVEEKQEKLSSCAMNLLSCYLRDAISESFAINSESCKNFAVAFHLIMAGSVSGTVCEKVVEHAMTLLTQESVRHLSYLKKESNLGRLASTGVANAVSSFCWLFKVAQKRHAAQAVVELLVNDADALYFLHDRPSHNGTSPPTWVVKRWARMIYSIFEDVTEGKLFLKTSQRVTLFLQGRWLMFDKYLNLGEAHIAELVTRFITTLPLRQQEECWKGTHVDQEGHSCDQAHMMWISQMITKKAQRQPELKASPDDDSSRLGFVL